MAARAVRSGLGKIAAQADKNLGLTGEHGVDRLDGVVALRARYLEVKALLQRIEKSRRRALIDAHGAIALHVAVAAHWAQASAGAAEVAAQQLQVDDLLNGRHRVVVLGDAHGPADRKS